MRKTLLEKYAQACKESNLAQHERLQENELLRVVAEALEEWTTEEWHGQEITLPEYERLLTIRERILEEI